MLDRLRALPGVAATAIASRRCIIATRVGGLPEQLAGEAMATLCDATAEDLTPLDGSRV